MTADQRIRDLEAENADLRDRLYKIEITLAAISGPLSAFQPAQRGNRSSR